MKILAIIPARSGSKRLPGKNIKQLVGKPLIAYSILAAKQSQACDEVMVSTDCQAIADIALKYGATVPWLRSANLAEDLSDVMDTVLSTLLRFEEQKKQFDSVLLLQPTSPFRTSALINDAVKLHQETGCSIVSVSVPTIKPAWFRTVDTNGNLISNQTMVDYAKDLTQGELYQLNGSIYLATVDQLIKHKSFYSDTTKALIIENPQEAIDIDTPLDWMLAERIMESKNEVIA